MELEKTEVKSLSVKDSNGNLKTLSLTGKETLEEVIEIINNK